jgi:hypothetical protein
MEAGVIIAGQRPDFARWLGAEEGISAQSATVRSAGKDDRPPPTRGTLNAVRLGPADDEMAVACAQLRRTVSRKDIRKPAGRGLIRPPRLNDKLME